MERHRRALDRVGWTRAGLIVGVLIAAAMLATAAIARVAGGPSDRVIALPGRFPAAIALDDIHHRLVVLDESGAVSLLNTDTGTLAHVIPAGAWRPAFSGGSGPALAVDPGAGRAIVALSSQPRQSTSAPPGAARVLDTVTGRVVASPHVGVGDTAIVAVPGTARAFVANLFAQTVTVLSTRDGRVLGAVAVAGQPTTLGVDGPAGVVAVGGNSFGATLDARTGRVLHTQLLDSLSVLVVDDRRHRALTYSQSGQISALDTRTGALVGQGLLGQPGPTAGDDPATGMVFFGPNAASGPTQLVDARTGRLVRALALPGYPIAFAADARTGHMLVLLSNARRRAPGPWDWLPAPIRRLLPALSTPTGPASAIAILDGRTGGLRQQIDLPIDGSVAVAFALDARAHRLYVTRTWWGPPTSRPGRGSDMLILDTPP